MLWQSTGQLGGLKSFNSKNKPNENKHLWRWFSLDEFAFTHLSLGGDSPFQDAIQNGNQRINSRLVIPNLRTRSTTWEPRQICRSPYFQRFSLSRSVWNKGIFILQVVCGHILQNIALDMVNLCSGAEIRIVLAKIISGSLLTILFHLIFPPLEVKDYVSFA